MPEYSIRPYKKEDRSYVRNIACDTAFIGEAAEAFFAGREILADFLTLYFTDHEGQSCFVAEKEAEVIGYIFGAKSEKVLKKISTIKILPKLLFKALISGVIFKKKNSVFFFHCFLSFLKGEFKMPDFSQTYPAVLHINLKENFRNLEIGSQLINTYLNYLNKEKIKGVHLSTLSPKAALFFEKHGFNLLHQGKRSYFRYILNKDSSIYCYGKRDYL